MSIVEDLKIIELDPSQLGRIAAIHRAAFPDSLISQLGLQATTRYYQWLLTGPHDRIALGIEKDSQLAGFIFAGMFRGALAGYLRLNRVFLIGQLLTRPWLVLRSDFFRKLNWKTIRRVFSKKSIVVPSSTSPAADQPKSRTFGVLSVAVDPQCQGGGLGAALMKQAEDVARERGFKIVNLTVNPSNLAATRFYERHGWSRQTEPDGQWTGSMVKTLEPK